MYSHLPLIFFFLFLISAHSVGAQENVYEDLGVAEFRDKLRASPDATLIDLRTSEEVQKGVIERAEIIDYYADDFKDQIGMLDRERTYFVYCAAGGRSGETVDIMKNLGFKKVYNLAEGYKAWVKAKQSIILPSKH